MCKRQFHLCYCSVCFIIVVSAIIIVVIVTITVIFTPVAADKQRGLYSARRNRRHCAPGVCAKAAAR